jgi:prepilin-type N-terminal cleavage/methylation domain-containing protein
MRPSSRQRGFTLAEVLIALSIVGMVVAGACALLLHNLSVGKLRVTRDIRMLTQEIAEEARNANFFRIYPSFAQRFRDLNHNGFEDSGEELPNGLTSDLSGDMVVFYFYDPVAGSTVIRTVGYYRAPANPNDPESPGPVRKFVLTENPLVLPDVAAINDFPEVVELSRGLAEGRLFLNYQDLSVVIQGEVEHPGNLIRRATNTYNFTVAPRG